MLGALPAALGKQAAFATIAAIEQYVENHYLRQIRRLTANDRAAALRSVLLECCRDEVAHKEDAQSRLESPTG